MIVDYAPGRAWCALTPHALAVFAPDTGADAVVAARNLLAAERDSRSLAEAVAAMPGAFVLVTAERGITLLHRFRSLPARLDGPDLSAGAYAADAAQPVEGGVLELGLLSALSAGVVPVAEGVVRAAAVRMRLDAAGDPPGLIARAADVDPAPATDELPVFRSAPGEQLASARPELVLQSGERIPLDRGVLIGRRPHTDRVDGSRPPRLVTVGSLGTMISRTHVRVEANAEGVVATDLHSTNGTSVARPGTLTQRLQPGVPARLHDGDILNLGDGVAITVSLGA